MKIASYNIMSGGFNTYTYDVNDPNRLDLLKKTLNNIDADFIGLVDTFRWKDIFSENNLKNIFNYKYAFCINSEDKWVDPNIGSTILTNLPLKEVKSFRISTTNCIKAVVEFNGKLIDIYTVYLNYLYESRRMEQIKYLLGKAKKKNSIIMGDLNSVAPEDKNELKKNFQKFIDTHPKFKKRNDYDYYIEKMNGLYKTQVIPTIRKSGFKDADRKYSNPTAFTKLYGHDVPVSIFRVDYILHTPDIKINNYIVMKGGIFEKASDHYPIVGEFQLN